MPRCSGSWATLCYLVNARTCLCGSFHFDRDIFRTETSFGALSSCNLVWDKYGGIAGHHFTIFRRTLSDQPWEKDPHPKGYCRAMIRCEKRRLLVGDHMLMPGQEHFLNSNTEITAGNHVFNFINNMEKPRKTFVINKGYKEEQLITVKNQLSRGEYGELHEGWADFTSNPYESCPVAVKVIDLKPDLKTRGIDHILREFKLHEMLLHDNIPKFHGAHISKRQVHLYLVMQLISGTTLEQLVSNMVDVHTKGLSESQIKVIFKQLFKALEYIHERGITHRDLKPSNVMVTKEPVYSGDLMYHTFLIDFGISAETDKMKSRCGALSYRAPEMLEVGEKYSSQIDIWASGATIYFCFFGEPPYIGDADRSKGPTFPSGGHCSPQAQALIRKLLAYEPNARPSSPEVLLDPWFTMPEMEHVAQHQPLSALNHPIQTVQPLPTNLDMAHNNLPNPQKPRAPSSAPLERNLTGIQRIIQQQAMFQLEPQKSNSLEGSL
ncbi:calcium-dependent protein kinase 2 [Pelomyxa schiedti]|nr:calcium-dependent protein kinase 2 [Pelomyxa schiedti]